MRIFRRPWMPIAIPGRKPNDLKDGAGSEPGECVRVYAVKVVDGEIVIGL